MDNVIKSVDDQLNEFVEKLLTKKDLSNLDVEVRSQVRIDLVDRIGDRINAALLENIPPEKLDKFEQVLDRKNQEEIMKFCEENIPNLQEVIAKELISFEEIYLGN